jgi:hypothetical protein
MDKDIETEVARKFYRPTVSSVRLYRAKLKAAQDAAAKALKPSAARAWKFWSLLVAITALSTVTHAHA